MSVDVSKEAVARRLRTLAALSHAAVERGRIGRANGLYSSDRDTSREPSPRLPGVRALAGDLGNQIERADGDAADGVDGAIE